MPFELGWFPFPAVEGGAGAPTDGFGGGNGFVVGKDAPPETVDFLGFLTNVENQRTWATAGSGIPANIEATAAIAEAPAADGPVMQDVLDALNGATFHAAVPRPVLHGRDRRRDQRPDGAAVRR